MATAAAAATMPRTHPTLVAPTPPAGDGPPTDPLRATCRLHGPGSLYTRNSEGYYSSSAPRCNGCQVGIRDTEENTAADLVRSLHGELLSVWATEYGRHTTEHAESVAERLHAAIAELDRMSFIITCPQQYAYRTLLAHEAAKELDELLVEAAIRDPHVTLRRHIATAMDRLRSAGTPDNSGVGDITLWPIWAAAAETLSVAEDHVADDRY